MAWWTTGRADSDSATGTVDPVIDFNRDIRPILSGHCFRCHGPDNANREAGLRLDRRDDAIAEFDGIHPIVPGDPDASELIKRITHVDPAKRMPKKSAPLEPQQVALLESWIKQGAQYAVHWAYIQPQHPHPPNVSDESWVRNDIDRFVMNRLDREGLKPSPAADRYALIRRVTLALTGLPPTVEQVDAFGADTSADAYEKVVDRLLADPSFGEHWARHWLDLARYADSAGYADDPERTIWAFRDYVIRAFNDDKPFDQFTIEQLAGDLLPDATVDQRVATAFHRNTQTNNEGGTDDEEFRNAAVIDRVNTTMQVWMGTTMMCAQCHDHKYDPISQREYFEFLAILNNTQDADRKDESPVIEVDTATYRGANDQLPLPEDVGASTTVPVMVELAEGERRTTHIQHRGNFMDKGEAVSPGFPAIFTVPGDATEPNRLDMARWLVSERNPLTARVIVNRYWEQLFGVGLVATSEEFGSQGELPSHSELLDWLATQMIADGWNTKRTLKTIVMSATYRQSSRVNSAQAEADPANRLLGRGPRFRMSAEMVRDQALAAGGLLSHKMYGPPVHPPQPNLGITSAFGREIDWQTSAGEDRYRRAIYTSWRRTSPYPSMTTFDAPNRQVCEVRRSRTNTPLQALVTMNDPVYVEAAQALARRMIDTAAAPLDRARFGFRVCLSRPPTRAELDQLVALHRDVYAEFDADPQAAMKMATMPLGPTPENVDVADLAAWTVVANVLLNLDEALMNP